LLPSFAEQFEIQELNLAVVFVGNMFTITIAEKGEKEERQRN